MKNKDVEEKKADKLLVKLMREEPVKVMQWFLVQLGKELVAANAAVMDIKQQSDVGKKRYEVFCKVKIKEVKKLLSNP